MKRKVRLMLGMTVVAYEGGVESKAGVEERARWGEEMRDGCVRGRSLS